MTIIIGGYQSGLLDGSDALLNRDDKTRNGATGHGEQIYSNVSNGNLLLQQQDAYIPSLGDDFNLVRTYNSNGLEHGMGGMDGAGLRGGMDSAGNLGGWRLSTQITITKQHHSEVHAPGEFVYEVTYGDGSTFTFIYDSVRDLWVSTDGAGAYETIEILDKVKGADPKGNIAGDPNMLDKSAVFVLTRANQTQYYFDKFGRLLSIVDTNNVRMDFEYDKKDLSKVYDDQGHIFSFIYYSDHKVHHHGNLEKIVDETGVVLVSYDYDKWGRLTTVTDREGHVTNYIYNNYGLLETVALPNQQVVDGNNVIYQNREIKFEYTETEWYDHNYANLQDVGGNSDRSLIVSKIIDAEGGETTFEYKFEFDNPKPFADQSNGNVGNGTNGNAGGNGGGNGGVNNGGQGKFYREFLGGVTRVVDALGNNRAYSNAQEYVDWRVANGYYATYDANDISLVAQVDAIRNQHALVYSYNDHGYITEVVDQQDFHTTYAYNNNDDFVSMTDRNGWGATQSDSEYYRQVRAELGYLDAAGLGKLVSELSVSEKAAILAHFTTTFGYDDRGNLLRSNDNEGHETTFTYADFNKVTSITSAMGHALVESNDAQYVEKRAALGYVNADGSGKLVSALLPQEIAAILALYTTRFEYDAKQNLVKRVDAGGDITSFVYDVYGNLTQKIVYLDANDLVDPAKQQLTQYFYDVYGNNVKTIDAEGNTTFSEYDHFGNLTRYTDGNGGIATYTYDDDNRLSTVTDQEGHVTINNYDAVGNRIAVTDANGHTVTRIYDRNNMLLATIDPSATNPNEDRTTSFQYDVVGNNTKIIDAEGRDTTYVYNTRRQLVEVISANVEGEDGKLTRYHSSYAYDGEGNRIRFTNNRGYSTDYLYSEDGLLKQEKNAIGHITRYSYDANHNQVMVVAGLQLAEANRQILKFRYDEENQLIETTDAEGGKTGFSYDAVGNVISVTDANGYALANSQDAWAQEKRVELHKNADADLLSDADRAELLAMYTTRFEFDKVNRKVREIKAEVIDPKTGAPVRYQVITEYDGNGNIITVTDENQHLTHYSFDKDNRMVLLQDANGNKTVFEYDSRHNRTKVAIGVEAHMDVDSHAIITATSNAQVVTYSYDEFNQLVAQTDGNGNALLTSDDKLYVEMRRAQGYIRLDAKGNPVRDVNNNTIGKLVSELTQAEIIEIREKYTTHLSYDKVGNNVTRIDNRDGVTRRVYDALNRAKESYDALNNKTTYRYDGNNNLVATTDAVGHALISSDEPYYQQTRLRLQFAPLAGNLSEADKVRLLELYTTHVTFDAVDRQETMIDAQGVETKTVYNDFGNVTTFSKAIATADERTSSYVYDLNNRLLSQSIDPAGLNLTTQFEYDAVGNRLKSIDARGNAARYVYDALNRNIKVIDPLLFETKLEFDGVGNKLAILDAKGGVTRFEFDAGNRVIKTTDAEGRVTTYAYDQRNNRISVTDGNGNALVDSDQAHYANLRSSLGYPLTAAELALPQNAAIRAELLNRYTKHYEYDANNNLRSVLDAEHNETVHDYDRENNRVEIVDGNGHVTSYVFDAVNRVIDITDAEGGVSHVDYDAVGNRIRMIDANAHAVITRDDAYYSALRESILGYAISAADLALAPVAERNKLEAAFTTQYIYDSKNQMIRQVNADGETTAYAYDKVGNQVDVYRAFGNAAEEQRTSYVYDKADRLKTRVNAIGNGLAYSDQLEYLEQRFALGYVVVDAGTGKLRAKTAAELNDSERMALKAAHSSHTEYDKNGNAVRQIDELGRVTEYVYDANNRVTTIVDAIGIGLTESDDLVYQDLRQAANAPRKLADLLALQNASAVIAELRAQHSTHYIYDEVGNRTQVIDALGNRTTSYYNLNNEVDLSVNAEGSAITYVFDDNGNVLSSTRHAKPVGMPVDPTVRPTLVSGADDQTTHFAYNSRNLEVRRVDALGYVQDTAYDAVGNKTLAIAYANPVTVDANLALEDLAPVPDNLDRYLHYRYDGNNRLSQKIDAENYYTNYSYDAVGNLIVEERLIEAAQAPTSSDRVQRYRYTYDAMNRVVSSFNGLDIESRNVYDAVGNTIAITQAYGTTDAVTTKFVFDDLNRMVEQEHVVDAAAPAKSIRTRYIYDAVGQKVKHIDAYGSGKDITSSFVFDDLGRTTKQTLALGTANEVSTAFAYDALGNLKVKTEAVGTKDQRVTTFNYDKLNRVEEKTEAVGTKDSFTSSYQYDAFGNGTGTVMGVGSDVARATQMVFDKNNRMIAKADANNITTLYDYDAFGNITKESITDIAGAINDPVGASAGAKTVQSMRYDGRDLQIRVTNGVEERVEYIQRRYDGSRNLRFETQVGITKDAAAVMTSVTKEYQYDDANRLIAEIVDSDGLAITARYGYDNRNNRTSEISANAYRAINSDDAWAVATRAALGITHNLANLDATDIAIVNSAFTSSTEYNTRNQAILTTNALGFSTRFDYDVFGNQIAVHTGLYEGTDPDKLAKALPATNRFAYDSLNRQTLMVDAYGIVTKMTYDARDNKVTEDVAVGYLAPQLSVDEANIVAVSQSGRFAAIEARHSVYQYDQMDRLTSETQPSATVVVTEYNVQGDVTRKILDQGNDPGNLNATTQYFYDAGGRVKLSVDPLGNVTKFEYDVSGNIKTKTEGMALDTSTTPPSAVVTADTRVVQYNYDGANRLLQEIVDPGDTKAGYLNLTTSYEYDERGNIVAITDAAGRRGETVYDGADQVAYQRTAEGFITRFERDAVGNKIAETQYADADRNVILTANTQLPGNSEKDQTTTYRYDVANKLIERTSATGVINRMEYDAVGNVLTDIQNAEPAAGEYSRITSYQYNLANLAELEVGPLGNAAISSDAAEWVSFRQEAGIVGADGKGKAAADLLPQDIAALRQLFATTYQYDAAYNMTRVEAANTWVDMDSAPAVKTELRVTEYQYDVNNRLVAEITDPGAGNLNLRKQYRYDAYAHVVAVISPLGQERADQAVPALAVGTPERDAFLENYTSYTFYDKAGRETFSIDELGYVGEIKYDRLGNMASGHKYAQSVKDLYPGIRISDFTAVEVVAALPAQTDANILYVIKDPVNDRQVVYSYNKANNQISTTLDSVTNYAAEYDADGLGIGYVKAANAPSVMVKDYDGVGNVIRETDANHNTVYSYYDSRGLKIGSIDGEGYLSLSEYDAFANVTKNTLFMTSLYDASVGITADLLPSLNLDQIKQMAAGIKERRINEIVYDKANNAKKLISPPADLYLNGVPTSNQPTPLEVTRTFDAFGNVLSETILHAANDANPFFKTYTYDVLGRTATETDARADELIRSSDPYFVNMRLELGLSDEQIRAKYTTEYLYDAENNLRVRREDSAVTTFYYDAAKRATSIKLPAVDMTSVDANGVVQPTVNNYRFLTEIDYDANGNMIRELKVNGTEVRYVYDARNNKIASVEIDASGSQGVYTRYDYNFNGDRTQVRRYYNLVTDLSNLAVPVEHDKDEIIEFSYDRQGRISAENVKGLWRSEDPTVDVNSDDRTSEYRYDANGNQVQIVDSRGFVSSLFFNANNVMTDTINPTGSINRSKLDAQGSVVQRSIGGWDLPKIVDNSMTQAYASSDGIYLEWSTTHQAEGIVEVTEVGGSGSPVRFGQADVYDLNHEIMLTGLKPDTTYEYRIRSKDPFGSITVSEAHTFVTTSKINNLIVSDVVQNGVTYNANISFSLSASNVSNLEVLVGSANLDSNSPLDLVNTQVFIPQLQANGSYTLPINFETDPASTYFQLRWIDSSGNQITSTPELVLEPTTTQKFDASFKSETVGGSQRLTVTWDLNPALAFQGNVYIGYSIEGVTNQIPHTLLATLNADGRYEVVFDNLVDGPVRNFFFRYLAAGNQGDIDPTIANTVVELPPVQIGALAGLDTNVQRMVLDLDLASNDRLDYFYRPAGATGVNSWIQVPPSSINGTSIDLLGIPEGDYDFKAEIYRSYYSPFDPVPTEQYIGGTSGTFSLREEGVVSNVLNIPTIGTFNDAVNSSLPVDYQLNGMNLSFPSLLPLLANQALALNVTHPDGTASNYPFASANIDLTSLAVGTHSLHITKTDTGTGAVLFDITGDVTIKAAVDYIANTNYIQFNGLLPLATGETLRLLATNGAGVTSTLELTGTYFDVTPLTPGQYTFAVIKENAAAKELARVAGDLKILPSTILDINVTGQSGLREGVVAYNLSDNQSFTTVGVSTELSGDVSDKTYRYYDGNGWLIYSNENGGVWTRYFYDTQGKVTKEVKFRQYDEKTATFLDEVTRKTVAPTIDELNAYYDMAINYVDPSQTTRVVTRAYDAMGNLIQETKHSTTHGDVTSEWQYDRWNNKTVEITAKGRSESLRTNYSYDNMGKMTSIVIATDVTYNDVGGVPNNNFASQSFTYDERGNQSTKTNERGYTERFYYDRADRLSTAWSAAGDLEVKYIYDNFNRIERKVETDLRPGASEVHTTSYVYDNFDQQIERSDAMGYITRMAYDKSGNKIREINANAYFYSIDNTAIAQEERRALGLVGDLATIENNPVLKQQLEDTLKAKFTESFVYDAENRVVKATDQMGRETRTTYDAYGNIVAEMDANGRITRYGLGPFGKINSKNSYLTKGIRIVKQADPKYADLQQQLETATGFRKVILQLYLQRLSDSTVGLTQGLQDYQEEYGYNWLGQQTRVYDIDTGTNPNGPNMFGIDTTNNYNDADELESVIKRVKDNIYQTSKYKYDTYGNRVEDKLYYSNSAGVYDSNLDLIRQQVNEYNARGWLTNSATDLIHESAEGPVSQNVVVHYAYDRAGNRTISGSGVYTYDKNNRMSTGWDSAKNQTINTMQYDAFGNRIADSSGTYSYDANKRLSGDRVYDGMGNALKDGGTRSRYNTADQIVYSAKSGSQTWMYYDGVGNVGVTHVVGDGYGFDELAYRDVRYTSKYREIANSWVDGAEKLYGHTSYTHDVNGQALSISAENYRTFIYDNDGKIIQSGNQLNDLTKVGDFRAYNTDPKQEYIESEYGLRRTVWEDAQNEVMGTSGNEATYNSYIFANGNQVGEIASTHQFEFNLVGMDPALATAGDTGTGINIKILDSDIVRNADGTVNRHETAVVLANRIYSGDVSAAAIAMSALVSSTAIATIVSQVEVKLPPATDIAAGKIITIARYLAVVDEKFSSKDLVTDYSFQAIGEKNPSGIAQHHTVRAGESLRTIAAGYYGSVSYWFLIAEANGLQGTESLKQGSTLVIPNVVANSVNDSGTYKVYNQSDIIGSESPHVNVKQKEKDFWDKLVEIVIIIIIIVVLVVVAIYAPELFATVYGALGGGVLAFLAATVVVAAFGYAVGYATSYATQSLAILAGLQEDYDWKAMQDMGESTALSAVAAGWASWATGFQSAEKGAYLRNAAIRVGSEAGRQLIVDGKITSYSNLVLAMIPAGNEVPKTWENAKAAIAAYEKYKKAVSAGLAMLEKASHGDSVNSMDWAGFAIAAYTDANKPDYLTDSNDIRWGEVAEQAAIRIGLGLVVGMQRGEDAGRQFVGQSLGNMFGDMIGEFDQTRKNAKDKQKSNKGAVATVSGKDNSPHEQTQSLNQIAEQNEQQRAREEQAQADNQKQSSEVSGAPVSNSGRTISYDRARGEYVDQYGNAVDISNIYADAGNVPGQTIVPGAGGAERNSAGPVNTQKAMTLDEIVAAGGIDLRDPYASQHNMEIIWEDQNIISFGNSVDHEAGYKEYQRWNPLQLQDYTGVIVLPQIREFPGTLGEGLAAEIKQRYEFLVPESMRNLDAFDVRFQQVINNEATDIFPWGSLSDMELAVAVDRGYIDSMRIPIHEINYDRAQGAYWDNGYATMQDVLLDVGLTIATAGIGEGTGPLMRQGLNLVERSAARTSMVFQRVASSFRGATSNASSSGLDYLVSQDRILRYESHLQRLLQNGQIDTERLGEFSGRIEMLRMDNVFLGEGKLVGKLSNPGGGAGTQGIDRVYRNVYNSDELNILESKYRTTYNGNNPLGLLDDTNYGKQMSTQWVDRKVDQMMYGPHGPRINELGTELYTKGYQGRYMNVLDQNGQTNFYDLQALGLQ